MFCSSLLAPAEQVRKLLMLKIAIVENEAEQIELLRGYIARYSEEKGEKCHVTAYPNGLEFI